MKRLFIIAMMAVVAIFGCFSMTACGEKTDFTVGVIQLAPHDALDKANKAFCDELTALLAKEGKTVSFEQGNANGEDTQNASIVNTFTGKNVDLIYSIATSSSVAAVSKAKDYDIPVVFNAVTDPVGESLVQSMENPGANVTGVSDINPVVEQVDLMIELMGGSKDITVGMLYTSKETNSVKQMNMVKDACEKAGIGFVEKGIDQVSDIYNGLNDLKTRGADILYLPTDNMLAENAAAVHSQNIKGINLPIVCGEGGMTNICGVATLSVDYEKLGKMAAQSAFDILMGNKKASEIAVKTQTEDFTYVVNQTVADAIGFEVPQSVKDKA